MTELLTEHELQKYGLNAAELLVKFKEQIQKDFEMANLASFMPLFDNPIGEDVITGVEKALKRLISSGSTNVQQLLYRVDIPEKQFGGALREHKNKSELAILTDLIVKRTLQKVIFKIIHSQ